jgi:hypothetical protein
MNCPKCCREMELEERDTSSGRDMRTYYCQPCKERVDDRRGHRNCWTSKENSSSFSLSTKDAYCNE